MCAQSKKDMYAAADASSASDFLLDAYRTEPVAPGPAPAPAPAPVVKAPEPEPAPAAGAIGESYDIAVVLLLCCSVCLLA